MNEEQRLVNKRLRVLEHAQKIGTIQKVTFSSSNVNGHKRASVIVLFPVHSNRKS